MTIELHPECKKRILEIVTEQLPHVVVSNNMFLERRSSYRLFLVEDTLPTKGVIKNQLENYIGDFPLFEFLSDTLSKELYENQKYDSDRPSAKLTEIEGYEDSEAVAKRLIESFTTLPWEYTLTIKFENDFGELFCNTIKKVSASDSIQLSCPDEQFKKSFPLTSGNEARDRSLLGGGLMGLGLGIFTPQEWDDNSTYFQVKADGFIGKYGTTTPLEEAVSILKSFCGLSIALRILKVNYTYRATPTKAKFFIHKKDNENWFLENTHELDSATSDSFNDLVFNDLDGALDSEERKKGWIIRNLKLIRAAFSNKEKATKLILAGQWLFESYCGSNGLLSFVQTTVALEILLGEKQLSDLMGLGELLRNRCAYLIGKTHQQREKVLNDFKKIYDVRSKIVHRGKSKLNVDERVLFSQLQWMCRRVIQEEMDLLAKDIEKA